tara:strand:+ start:282 stop:512 length:231 start_codon:yes stop_codon:yes gene_type:complete
LNAIFFLLLFVNKINPFFVHIIEVLTKFTTQTSVYGFHIMATDITRGGVYFFFLMLNSLEAERVAKLALTIAPNAI